MPIPIIVEGVGLTVEKLLFRWYGRRGNSSAMLDKTYALNPGLAALGTELPLRTPLTLPDLPVEKPTRKRQGVNLFGD